MPDQCSYTSMVAFPLGYWLIKATDAGISSISYTQEKPETTDPNEHTTRAAKQLDEYFNKERTTFDLELVMSGHTDFHKNVWEQVAQIGYGKTASYSEIAMQLGNPLSVRAVGTANGRNPYPLVIPCHRVIGKNKKLTGYAYGLELKEWLLIHEGALSRPPTLFEQQDGRLSR